MGKAIIIQGADFSANKIDTIPIGGKSLITVLATPEGKGSVSGGGLYDEGDTITIVATPSEGYRFVSWNDGNINASRSIVVGSSDATYTATFEIDLTGWQTLAEAGYTMVTVSTDDRLLTATTSAPVGALLRVVPEHEDISVGLAPSAGPTGKGNSNYWTNGYSGGTLEVVSGLEYPAMRMKDKSTVANHYTEAQVAQIIMIKTS